MAPLPQAPKLTPEELARQRRRSLALGLVLGTLAVLFYAVTLVKTGSPLVGKP
jgi:hypothetical protein